MVHVAPTSLPLHGATNSEGYPGATNCGISSSATDVSACIQSKIPADKAIELSTRAITLAMYLEGNLTPWAGAWSSHVQQRSCELP
jgi:hypothetical protein